LCLAVNVCPAQLERGVEYVLDVSDALADAALPGTQLTLEVSERALDSLTRRSRDTMNRLAELGLSFSVDDFGMGQRSWTYLRTLPVSEIKVDRQLIHQCPDDRVSSAMLRAYATLAHEMGLNCVAMGVETREQHDAVVSSGIARAQGFLYEEPVRVEALADFLRRNRENAPSRAGQQPQ
jgi:diguanylate cyclase